MSKPEIAGYRWETKIPDGIGGGFGYGYASHWSTGPSDAEKLIRLTDHEAERATDKARIAELEHKNTAMLDLYREAESALKQCVIDREEYSDELRACTESPGGCGYWREAAKHREAERNELLGLLRDVRHRIDQGKVWAGMEWQYSGVAPPIQSRLVERIDTTLAKLGKGGE